MTTDTEIARSTLASLSNLFTDLRGVTVGRERQLDIMEEMVTNCVLHLCSANDSYQRSIDNYDILINAREETNMLQEEKIKLQEEKIKLQEEKIKLQDGRPLVSIMEAYKDPTPVIVHMRSESLGTRRKCTIKSKYPGYYTE